MSNSAVTAQKKRWMANLIRKDLLMHKTGFPFYVPIMVGVMALQAWRGFPPSVYIILVCIYATIVPTALMAIEDRVRAGAFNCSLPVTRGQVARAKYVISWVLAVVTVLTGLAIYSVITAPNLGAIWNLSTANQVLVILSPGLGLTLPVLMRFGWAGMMISYFVLLTLVLVSILVVVAFFPNLQITDWFISVFRFIGNFAAQFGQLKLLVVIVVAGVVLNMVSCKIAVAMFKRREF